MRRITTIKGLKREVKRIAGKGVYHAAKYEITEYHTGEIAVEYAAYINEIGWSSTYEDPEYVSLELKKRKETPNDN